MNCNEYLSQEEIDFDALETEPERIPSAEQFQETINEPKLTAEPSTEPRNGEPEQILLLHVPEWHEEHWKQMPEFVQKDLMPFKTIFLHFETRADMEAFSKLVGQKIGLTTPSIWYPEATIEHWNKQWVDSHVAAPIEDDEVEIVEG